MRYLFEMTIGFFIGKRNGGEYYFMERERCSQRYEARELDAALAIVNMCMKGIDAIPEDFYSPIDEFVLEAYQALDEAHYCLMNATKELYVRSNVMKHKEDER